MAHQAFAYSGARAWNHLPKDLRKTDNYFRFKSALGNLPEYKIPKAPKPTPVINVPAPLLAQTLVGPG